MNVTDNSNATILFTTDHSNATILFTELGKISIITAYSLVAIIGIPGNTFILYVLSRKKNRKNSCDTFVMSLALCDLLASAFIPFVMINDLVFMNWKFGSFGCKVLPSFNVVSLFASAWSLVVISVDRLRIVYCPFRIRLSTLSKSFLIASVWLCAVMAAYPYASVLTLDNGVCWDNWEKLSDKFTYHLVISLFVCFCPIAIMTGCYACAWKKIQNTSVLLKTSSAGARRIQQNKRALTMFIIIVTVYSCLITPYFILVLFLHTVHLYFSNIYNSNIDLLYELNYGLFTLAAFNSCVNCFIYARMHSTIGKRILSKRSFDSRTTTRHFLPESPLKSTTTLKRCSLLKRKIQKDVSL